MKLIVIASNKEQQRITHFLRAFDVHRKYECIASFTEEEFTPQNSTIEKYLLKLKAVLELEGYQVIAIFFAGVSERAYWDRVTKVISDGTKQMFIFDIFKHHGLEIVEQMQTTEANNKP